ncbi:hypothetical protein A2U01_0035588 [Trifolium medium]|uniref:Uncharacterized protein n=1 Tax=Trifolium medium TaxID=97028 RepID=A0A392PS32_9FABA|nr:hypothetical protein [Trifolium medium]
MAAQKGRVQSSTVGATTNAGESEGRVKEIPATVGETGVAQPSSSHTAPAAISGATPSLWDPLFNPMAFIEKTLNIVGDMSSLAAVSTDELRRRSLGQELKGLLLNYLLSSRQEQEAMEAKRRMEVVDKNLASIEAEYTAVKEKLGKELEGLKSGP